MKALVILLVLAAVGFAGGYDQLHVDVGLWMPDLNGMNDFLKNHSEWNTEFPNAGVLLTGGYRHRWEGFFALGVDTAIWYTSTSVSDEPVDEETSDPWFLTGDIGMMELWVTALPQFCFGDKNGFEFFVAPEISFIYLNIHAHAEATETPHTEVAFEDYGEVSGAGGGLGLQMGATWKLSDALGLGGTVRYIFNDFETDFDRPDVYPDKTLFGLKGLSLAPRLSINL